MPTPLRKHTTEPPTTQHPPPVHEAEAQENDKKRQALDDWLHVEQHIYSKGNACMGGIAVATMTTGLNAAVTVASINIRGLTDVKLELMLQSFVAEKLDVLFIIDTQLDKKESTTWGKRSNDGSTYTCKPMHTRLRNRNHNQLSEGRRNPDYDRTKIGNKSRCDPR